MLITCPECQFARNINADSIPSKAQLATCPRCQNKFRFRILPEEEEQAGDAEQADEANSELVGNGSDDSVSPVGQLDEDPISEEVLDDVLRTVEAAEELVDTTASPVPEGVDDESLSQGDEAEVDGVGSIAAVEDSSITEEDVLRDEPVEEVQSEDTEPVEQQVEPVEDFASAQPVKEAMPDSVEACKSEDEAVQRYAQENESSGMEAASAHIVRDADSGKYDIWDAIAAMGEEHECENVDIATCGAASAHVIPWEDGRLNSFTRLFGTVGGLLVRPASFWCGMNAKSSLLLPLVFFLLSCIIAIVATVGWLRGIAANWSQILDVIQPIIVPQGAILSAITIPDVAVPVLVLTAAGLLVLPFVLGGITHMIARMIGGCASPFGIGFRTVAYSSGAFLWILVPVAGVFLSLLYLFILYVHGVRAGYNLSLLRSVVTVVTVGLLLTAAALMITAGVSFM